MKNEKRITLVSLTILALLLTGFTWAYWNNTAMEIDGVLGVQGNTVQVGTGNEEKVTTTVSVTGNQIVKDFALVPKTQNKGDAKLSTVTLINNVVWNANTNTVNGAKGKLQVDNFQLSVDGNGLNHNQLAKMFIVDSNINNDTLTIQNGKASLDKAITVTLTFEKEPETKAIYNAIAGKELSISYDVTIVEQ